MIEIPRLQTKFAVGYIDVANLLNNTPVVNEKVNPETGNIVGENAAGVLPMFGLAVCF